MQGNKCKSIYDELKPFDFDLEAWQKANPEKMARVRREVFNIPNENRWEKGNEEVIEKSTRAEILVAIKQTQNLRVENLTLEERVARLERLEELVFSYIEIPPK